MQLPRKLVLAGVILGIIPIALGIVGLVTKQWHQYNSVQYNLFDVKNNTDSDTIDFQLCFKPAKQSAIQGLEIGGVAAIGVGIIATVVLHTLVKNRWLRLLPQILLILGPSAILVGLILFQECVKREGLGWSFILMIAAGISGYIVAVYLAVVTACGNHQYHNRTSATIIVRESVRF
ncbi:unnamed protein product [Adineta ricciae]|uniref:Uncharacterized protein n=1 Tax=Adineta ricciae TaxID=249248 RepID=A0A814F8D1_ADIRI|nr:unnamed protein product [Adineta ricciae]CAF1031795.1 unnamed protein product [Adineta ricciae]